MAKIIQVQYGLGGTHFAEINVEEGMTVAELFSQEYADSSKFPPHNFEPHINGSDDVAEWSRVLELNNKVEFRFKKNLILGLYKPNRK